MLPPLPDQIFRNDTFLERSHEYLGQLQSVRTAMNAIQSHRDKPVLVTEFYFRQTILPMLGYVDRPLNGYTTMSIEYPTLKIFHDCSMTGQNLLLLSQ